MDCHGHEHRNNNENEVMNPVVAAGKPDTVFEDGMAHNRIRQPARHFTFTNSPYAWRPSTIPETPHMEHMEDDLLSSVSLEQYFDPFEAEANELSYGGGLAYRTGSIFDSVSDRRGDAKKVCGQISKLLRDKNSPSKGSRMFQKRRKRSEKFAIIGYGTQPTEEDYSRVSESEDSASEELSRIDYGTSDDEIPAYDKPGINNALTAGDQLDPSEQLIQRQLKNLAMDASGMRGKGAKIFAKRQQRMENYIVTDENRRNVRRRSDQGSDSAASAPTTDSSRPAYFRPGSSIGIAAKPTYSKNKPPVVNRNMSGYGTDVEDDYRRPFKQQVNYYSDCEGPTPKSDKPRRTRPANRRAWESEDEGEGLSYPHSGNEGRAPQNVAFNYSFSPDVSPVRSQPPQPEEPQSPRQQFRRVLPPGHAPIPRMPPTQRPYDPLANVTERRSSHEQKPPHPEPQNANRRTWSRVSFQPIKRVVQPSAPTPVVDYPCERTQPSAKAKPPTSGGYRTASQSPQRPLVSLPQSSPKRVTANQPPKAVKQSQHAPVRPQMPHAAKPTQPEAPKQVYTHKAAPNPCGLSKSEGTPAVSKVPEQKPPSAVSLLEKPITYEPAPADRHSTPSVNQQDTEKGPTDQDFVVVPEPVISRSDFVKTPEEEAVKAPEEDSTTPPDVTPSNVTDGAGTSPNECEANQRSPDSPPSSPVSVASYVSSTSSSFTSMLPSRCLSPPARPYTPNGGKSSPRAIKIASKSKKTQPLTPVHGTIATHVLDEKPDASSTRLDQPATPKIEAVNKTPIALEKDSPFENNYASTRTSVAPPPPPPPPQLHQQQRQQQVPSEPTKDKKISACLKVLDPTKTLLQPKPQVQYQPSPTLNALLQSENESSYGSLTTPPISYCPPSDIKSLSDVKSPPRRVRSASQPPRERTRSSSRQPPQPLGMIAAEGMRGKGAKMFEKQQKRMEQYSKETSAEDFPELKKERSNGSINSPVMNGKFSYPQRNGRSTTPGFSPDGKKLQPGKEVRSGMMQVMGEFQKGSKPGNVKRPSETKKKGRDPLYYQQYLFYQPPSDADFVDSPQNANEPPSGASYEISSRVNESDFVASPNASMTSMATQDSEASQLSGGPATSSTSSISSHRSSGPKTAPKPSKAIISRQLSKPTSPVPAVSVSPTPDVQGFKPTPTSPTPSHEENDYSFNGVSEHKNASCIEDMIKEERPTEEHRGGTQDESISRQRVLSEDTSSDEKARSLQSNGIEAYSSGNTYPQRSIHPLTYTEAKPRLFNVSNNALPRDGAIATSHPAAAKPAGFSVPKPKFSPRRSGIEVKMWKPGQ